jgi:toxin-antitoxin system PIN domain toxin
VILIDANILLYAYDRSGVHHKTSKAWLEDALSGEEEIRFALITLLAFLRISTNPGVFRRPLSPAQAIEAIQSWLSQSQCDIAGPTDRHWEVVARLARTGQARGPLLMDAHLAALALEFGATLYTSDRDFARFPKVRFRDPTEP